MQGKGLIIAAVLFAVLGGGVWYSNHLEAGKEGKPPEDSSPKLIDVKEDQFTRFEILRRDSNPVIVEGSGSSWKMTAPQQLSADAEAIGSLAATVGSFGTEKLIEEKAADLQAFGLDHPSLTVEATTKDKKHYKLLIGDETPTGSGFYAKLDGDPRVFTTYPYNRASIDKDWKDLRDKRLLKFDDSKVSRMEISARGQSFELGKDASGDWQITKPGIYRADNLQAEEMLRRLKEAKMDALSDEEAAKVPAAFAAGTLVAHASVTTPEGTQQIEVRRNKENYFARSSVIEGVFQVPADLGNGLDKSMDDLRNRKLFDFGFNDPNRVEVREGEKVTTIVKAGENWQRNGKNLDAPEVQQIINKLRDLATIKFLPGGFTTPVLELTVVSDSGKKTEKIQISRQGNSWIARRENEAALYELDGKVVEEIQQSVASLKEAASTAKK